MAGVDFDKLISTVGLVMNISRHDQCITFHQLVASEAHQTSSAKIASFRVGQMLHLRSALNAIPAIRHALWDSSSDLLKIIAKVGVDLFT